MRNVTVEPELSMPAREQARALGREMAKRDSWICPLSDLDSETSGADLTDYSQFAEVHRCAWMQTTQWEVGWCEQLCDITEADAKRQGVDRYEDWETWYWSFQYEAKDALWDAWDDAVNLVGFWKEHYAHGDSLPA